LIMVDGVAWYPRDIEEALCQEPGVRQAALIGIGDAADNQEPAAFLTLTEGTTFDGDALKHAIAGRLTYDLSRLSIRSVEALPMTPTGKISKSDLKTMFAAGSLS
jgi:long-chain acyl-CoA synthetase